MTDIKISALTAAPNVTDAAVFPMVQTGTTYKTTMAQALLYMSAGVSIAESQVTNLTTDLAARLVNSNNLSDVSSATTALSNLGGLPLAGGTMTGALTLSGAPTQNLHAATKLYVDNNVTAYNNVALAATTGNLVATYNNGSSGVGATLTNAGAQAAFSTDGVAGTLDDVFLVANQTLPQNNGLYVLTTVGSPSSNWVLTRSTRFNQNGPGNIYTGATFFVTLGDTYGQTGWILTTRPGTFTVGTTPIVFTEIEASGASVAGNGLTIAGNVISANINTSNLKFTSSAINTIQNIDTTATPTFQSCILNTLSANKLVGTDGSKTLVSKNISTFISGGTNVTIVDNGAGGVTVNATTGGITGFTQGSVVFINSSGVPTQDNAKFYWDDTNFRLGINTNTPLCSLDVQGSFAWKITQLTGITSYTVVSTDTCIAVDTSANAVAITLPDPTSQENGRVIIVKDYSGNALTHNITITSAVGTIDGGANFLINGNYGVLRAMSFIAKWITF